MPLGVPMVPYRSSAKQENPEWLDLYNRLFRARLLFLGSMLDDQLCNILCSIMVYLSLDDPKRGLFLYINSPGGSVLCGMSLHDMIRSIQPCVSTIGLGTAESMASFVLSSGTPRNRIALPNLRCVLHEPFSVTTGQVSDMVYDSDRLEHIKEKIYTLYTQTTGQPRSQIIADLHRDFLMTAHDIQDYGIVDTVVSPKTSSTYTPQAGVADGPRSIF